MNKIQFMSTTFMWLLGHVLIFLTYRELALINPTPFNVVSLAAISAYAHYRLSFYFASKFY